MSLAGLVICITSCRTWGLHRSKPVDSVQENAVVEPAKPVASVEVNAVAEPAKAESVPPAVVSRPWYKRMWGGGKSREQSPLPTVASSAPWYKPWAWGKGDEAKETEISASGGTNEPDRVVGQKPPELSPEARPMFSPSGEPLIKVGYSLRVSVSAGGKTEVAEQVKTVSDKGMITLPLIGAVRCEGMTLKELSDRLEELFGQFIRDPQVSADFMYEGRPGEISPWGAVIVWGAVRSPGRVNIPPTRDLTVSRAIQLAGGMDKGANEEAITVQRPQKGKIVVDLLSAAKRGMPEKDIPVHSGDVIYVPLSVW